MHLLLILVEAVVFRAVCLCPFNLWVEHWAIPKKVMGFEFPAVPYIMVFKTLVRSAGCAQYLSQCR